MESIAKAFLESAELQTAIVIPATWLIMQAAKRLGVLPVNGADVAKRVAAALTAFGVAVVGNWLATQASGEPVDWGKAVAAALLAWVGSTVLHNATRKPKPEG
jgi:hypothetical protein